MTAVAERPAQHLEADHAPAGDRFVGTGLLLITALFAAIQLLAGEVIPPLAVPGLIYATLGMVVLRRRPRWLLVSVAALLVLHLATSIPFFAAALAHPETPASFIPDALIGIVAVATIAGAILGLRGATSRRAITVVAAALALVAIGVSLVAAGGVESAVQQPGDVVVEAAGAQFPAQLQVPANGAGLWVDNQDPFRHTIVVEGTDLHAELPGSTAVRVETDLAPGTYRYFCDVPGHERMEGELVAR
jgi:plastocyanin